MDRTQQAYQFFLSRGYTPVQSAAIAGHLSHESNFNPSQTHDGGIGIGIAGWNGDRRARLGTYAASVGASPLDFGTQLGYVDWELKNRETGAYQALQAAPTVRDATTAMMHYERPSGYTPDNPTAGHGYDSRLGRAAGIYASNGGDPSAVGTPVMRPEADGTFQGQGIKIANVTPGQMLAGGAGVPVGAGEPSGGAVSPMAMLSGGAGLADVMQLAMKQAQPEAAPVAPKRPDIGHILAGTHAPLVLGASA